MHSQVAGCSNGKRSSTTSRRIKYNAQQLKLLNINDSQPIKCIKYNQISGSLLVVGSLAEVLRCSLEQADGSSRLLTIFHVASSWQLSSTHYSSRSRGICCADRCVEQLINSIARLCDVVASGCAGDTFDKRLILILAGSMPDYSRGLFDVAVSGHADDTAVLRSTPDPNLSSD
uniref:Uncharacterized protein n=1 Tax=Ditylenchus dipsaci TaxID=166011 RepID=A0A915EHC2_9BILA